MQVKQIVLALAVVAWVVVAALTVYICQQDHVSISSAALWVIFCISGSFFLDVYRLKPSDSHTIRSAILEYLSLRAVLLLATYVFRQFKKSARNSEKQQLQLLLKFLKDNKKTKFSRDHHLEQVKSVSEYRERVPLTRYEYYCKYIKAVEEDGQADILFPGVSDYLAMTSGTSSGKSKVFPKRVDFLKKKFLQYMIGQKLLLDFPIVTYLRKFLFIRVYPKFTFSKLGVKRGPISGLNAESNFEFMETTPENCGCIESEKEALYINALFALAEEEIYNIQSGTSSTLLTFFKLIENKWQQLCDDIEKGRVWEELDIPEELKARFNKHLHGGSPRRAAWLREQFKEGTKDMVQRIWPTCQAVLAVTTGTFQIQSDIIRESYLGNVPLLSHGHHGTETSYGFCLYNRSNMSEYFFATNMNFFEFIREEDIEQDHPPTYLCHQLEPGRKYEIVVTTSDGLYRYRTDDVVLVTGFYYTVPKYEFVQRASDILSVCTEKVPEFLLHDSLFSAARDWNVTITGYTTTESFHAEKLQGKVSGELYYLLFVELENGVTLSEEQCQKVDGELMSRHDVYAAFRRKGTVAPIHVCQVRDGTFEAVKEKMLATNKSTFCLQYKVPAIVKRDDVLEILLSRKL